MVLATPARKRSCACSSSWRASAWPLCGDVHAGRRGLDVEQRRGDVVADAGFQIRRPRLRAVSASRRPASIFGARAAAFEDRHLDAGRRRCRFSAPRSASARARRCRRRGAGSAARGHGRRARRPARPSRAPGRPSRRRDARVASATAASSVMSGAALKDARVGQVEHLIGRQADRAREHELALVAVRSRP